MRGVGLLSPLVMNLSEPQYFDNNSLQTPNYIADDEFTVDDILALLADMNGKSGYDEMLEAWSVWDTLTSSADVATRSRMLEACRQFAVNRASALRNGAA